jgi:hypothetical protein
MKQLALIGGSIAALWATGALADYVYRDGAGNLQTIFSFTCQTTKICPAQVLMDSTGTEKGTAANPVVVGPAAGSFTITGNVGISSAVQPTLGTANGWAKKNLHALSTTIVAIKASSGQLSELHCYNPNASAAYVQIFDNAAPVLGTTVPDQILGIGQTASASFSLQISGGQFSTAINVAAATTATGNTALGTALECGAFYN